MNNNAIFSMCLIIIFIPALAIGDDATTLPITPKTPMVLCPKVHVGPLTLNSTTQTVDLGTPDCVGGYAGGGVGWIYAPVFGLFKPSCPADHPYLGGFNEGWGGTVLFLFSAGIGAAGMSVTCCTTPQPQMYATVGYSPTTGTSTWQQGTACP